MSSYVVVSASRGLGYEWLKQLSKVPTNTVIGLVRNISKVQAKLDSDNIKNVHLLQADMVDHQALNAAAAETAKITPGVDYLIVNGALFDANSQFLTPTDFIGREEELRSKMIASLEVNVVGVIYSINAFLPLVRKGTVKNITVISTGMADADLVLEAGVGSAVIYASLKAATNIVVAKYAVELKSEGITLLALSPGLVNTRETQPTEEEMKGILALAQNFKEKYPHFEGPITPEESVIMQKKVIESVNLAQSGSFLSHLGNKQWL